MKNSISLINFDIGEKTVVELNPKARLKRRFYDIVLLIGVMCCLLPAWFSGLTLPLSLLLLCCITVSFFDENFYIYAALFMYFKYRMLIGETPVFRVYSYMIVLKFLIGFFKVKFRVAYFPAIFVIALHCIFAVPQVDSFRMGLSVIVDTVVVYIIVLELLKEKRRMRKYLFMFIIGGVLSGIYSFADPSLTIDINVSGAGSHKVSRSFGVLGDANFAGLFYAMCFMCSVVLKGPSKWIKLALAAFSIVLILETGSLSALLTVTLLSAFYIVLKFRGKSVFILFFAFVALVVGLSVLLSVPWFRKIDVIAGLIIRVEEKLSYIPRGRWDLLTTDRTALWETALNIFKNKSTVGQLIGGSVITIMVRDEKLVSMACHNSYIQSLMNFGVLGTLLIYIPAFGVFGYRLYRHFSQKPGYDGEDIRSLQMLFSFVFLVFGMTVDFFVEWSLMLFYFI